MMITMGPTGNIVKGDVLDNNLKGVERAIKAYDSKLYIKWNPKKMGGWGCWEIRRSPDLKQIVDIITIGNASIVRVDYQEMDLINHVLDVGRLDYRVLIKLREMDMWSRLDKEGNTALGASIEYEEFKWRENNESKKASERRYTAKHHQRLTQDLKDLALSGEQNLHRLLQYSHWSNKGSN